MRRARAAGEGRASPLVRALLASAAVAAVVFGALVRVWILGRNPMNSDEAVVGLMARQIAHGHFFAFYWGQRYGGPEAYPAALLGLAFGFSPFVLRLTATVLAAVAALLVWRIGRRLLGPVEGVVAALAFWIWPEVDLWASTNEYGFRWLVLVCGLTALLCALRIRAGSLRFLDWAGGGLAIGVGWWASPEIGYLALPAVVLAVSAMVRRAVPVRITRLVAALGAAALGALPWLYDNVGSGFPSLRAGAARPSHYLDRLRIFFVDVLPMFLGLRLRAQGTWEPHHDIGWALYGVVLALLAGVLVALVVRRRARVLVLAVVAFPFLYALPPYTSYWKDGRYGLYLAPFLALTLGALAGAARRWSRLIAVGIGTACLAASLVAIVHLRPERPASGASKRTSWLVWHADPNTVFPPLAAALRRAGIDRVYASYWIAYDLAFIAGPPLVATPAELNRPRYPPDAAIVAASPRPAWIFVDVDAFGRVARETGSITLQPGCGVVRHGCFDAARFERWLSAQAVAYRVVTAPGFTVVQPDRYLPLGAVFSQRSGAFNFLPLPGSTAS